MEEDAPVTREELEAMQRRADGAAAEPWESFVEGRDHHGGDDFIRTGGLDDESPDMYVTLTGRGGARAAGAPDLDFIAHARQDLPRLIAEVKRLNRESQ